MIRVESLTKTYAGEKHPAVEDLSFETAPGEFLTLLGPSGCGKSTTLRSIAGLETPGSGEIHIDGRTAFSSTERVNLSPAKRGIGMVFQSYAVWPHMTVAENVEYPLKRQGIRRHDRRRRVLEALELVGLASVADRPAPNLSGGQQQRVALARALVGRPSVLLLDEPLSNLDARLRRELGQYLRELQRQLGLTVLYVTHDQDEAMSMSDTVGLMNHGTVMEWAAPELVYKSPQTEFGARFLGAANFIRGKVAPGDGEEKVILSELGPIRVEPAQGLVNGTDGLIMVRPERLKLAPSHDAEQSSCNRVSGVATNTSFLGMYWETTVKTADDTFLSVRSIGERWWSDGDQVSVMFAPSACVAVRPTAADGADSSEMQQPLHVPAVPPDDQTPGRVLSSIEGGNRQ